MKVLKDYICEDGKVETITGIFNGTDAEWDGCTSTIDSRIEWEDEPEESWVYKDFSFQKV